MRQPELRQTHNGQYRQRRDQVGTQQDSRTAGHSSGDLEGRVHKTSQVGVLSRSEDSGVTVYEVLDELVEANSHDYQLGFAREWQEYKRNQ